MRADAESLSDFAVFGGGFKQHAFNEIAVGEREQVFFVSSPALLSPASFAGSKSKRPARNSASFAGMAGKAFGSKIFLAYTQSNTCFARNFSNPAAESSEASSSRESA